MLKNATIEAQHEAEHSSDIMPGARESNAPPQKAKTNAMEQRLTRAASCQLQQAGSQSLGRIERASSADAVAFNSNRWQHGMLTRTASAEIALQFGTLSLPASERDNAGSRPRTSGGSSPRVSRIRDIKQSTRHGQSQAGMIARRFSHSPAPIAAIGTAAAARRGRAPVDMDGFLLERRLQQVHKKPKYRENRERVQSEY